MKTGRPKLQRTIDGIHKCSICKELKPLVEFYSDSSRDDGYGSRCKVCNKSYKRKYNKIYQQNHKKEISARRRVRYAANKDKFREWHRGSYKRHREKWLKNQRNRHLLNPIPNMLMIAKTRAKRKGLIFELDVSDIIIPEYCPALGIKLEVGAKRAHRNSPSLDRIDNAKGYIKGNVVVVSHRANTIKNDATIEEMRRLLDFYESLK